MIPEAEWAEIARVQELLRTVRDPDCSAEERIDACIDYFDWLDTECPGWSAPEAVATPPKQRSRGVARRIVSPPEIDENRLRSGEMETKQRGRPRRFDGREQVHLTGSERAHLRALAEREDRSVSAVCRQLIREALAARESQRGKRSVA